MKPATLPTPKAEQLPVANQPAVPAPLPVAIAIAASAVPLDLLKQYASEKPILVQSVQFKQEAK
jgi:hypothetical protein